MIHLGSYEVLRYPAATIRNKHLDVNSIDEKKMEFCWWCCQKKISDGLSVYAKEMLASSCLTTLHYCHSTTDIDQNSRDGTNCNILWIAAHVGIKGNKTDKLAKESKKKCI